MSPPEKNVRDCTVLQFANDIVIYHPDNDHRNISKTLCNEVGEVKAVLEESGLQVAFDKREFCSLVKTRR
jgi:hypothetical protein